MDIANAEESTHSGQWPIGASQLVRVCHQTEFVKCPCQLPFSIDGVAQTHTITVALEQFG